MTNLTATPGWDDVLQLEVTTPVLGGPGGVANAQAQALLNRFAALAGTGSGQGAPNIGFNPSLAPPAINRVDWAIQAYRGAVNVVQYIPPSEWGAIRAGTSTTDLSDYIQAAWDQNKAVWHPEGLFPIAKPLKLRTQCKLYAAGVATRFQALPALASFTFPSNAITPSTYSPVLPKVPMMYTPSAIQWWELESFMLDGNGQDVYGMYLVENYYGMISGVEIIGTLNRPYTNIRGQDIEHYGFKCYQCGDDTHDGGALTYDTTNLTFSGGGFERLAAEWYLDQRQPNSFNKGGNKFTKLWIESEPTHRPRQGFIRLSGRGNEGTFHMALDFTATTERAIELNDTTNSVTVDNITMGANACVGAKVWINNTTGAMPINLKAGTKFNEVAGFFNSSTVTDSGVGNTFDLNGSLATPLPHVTGRWQVRNGGTTPSVSATAFIADFDWNAGTPTIRVLGSNGNTITNPSGNLTWTSALASSFVANGNINYTATSFLFNSTTGGLKPPDMTTTQRDAMAAPLNGMIIHNTTLGKLQGREGGTWSNLI